MVCQTMALLPFPRGRYKIAGGAREAVRTYEEGYVSHVARGKAHCSSLARGCAPVNIVQAVWFGLISLTAVAMFANHGALVATLKNGDKTPARAQKVARSTWFAYWVLLIGCMAVGSSNQAALAANYYMVPRLWVLPLATLLIVWLAGMFNATHRPLPAVAFASAGIAGVLACVACLLPDVTPESVPAAACLDREVIPLMATALVPMLLGYAIWLRLLLKRAE